MIFFPTCGLSFSLIKYSLSGISPLQLLISFELDKGLLPLNDNGMSERRMACSTSLMKLKLKLKLKS
jgi:hypothetical protein